MHMTPGYPAPDLHRLLAGHPVVRSSKSGDGLFFLHVDSPKVQATICLQGAQIIHFQTPGDAPVLWQGVPESFLSGKALRAGIPICWPWFSNHPQPGFPAHGFARNHRWDLHAIDTWADGRLHLRFELPPLHPLWPQGARLSMSMTLGSSLELELLTENQGQQPVIVSQALHTYLHVKDVRQVVVRGLEPYDYFDYGQAASAEGRPIVMSQHPAMERLYKDERGFCELTDPLLKRSIIVTSSGCRSTVVWNPGEKRALAMGDLGPQGHLNMLCIEAANAPLNQDAVTLLPGTSHRLAVQYRSVPHTKPHTHVSY